MEFFFKKKFETAYAEVAKYLDDHVRRLTDENRFLVSYSRLRHRFPEYDEEIMTRVWDRLRTQGKVKLDPLDGEWIVAKV